MGGYGSGRKGWRPVAERALKLDLRRLRRLGIFSPGQEQAKTKIMWSDNCTQEKINTAELSYCLLVENPWFRLSYNVTDSLSRTTCRVEESFGLEPFPQPYGGWRWYLICPDTGLRCQCLFLPLGCTYFRSRRAYQMQYHSQCLTRPFRLVEQAHKISLHLLDAAPDKWRKAWWCVGDLPPKPPWMRWGTYNARAEEWRMYMSKADSLVPPEWHKDLWT